MLLNVFGRDYKNAPSSQVLIITGQGHTFHKLNDFEPIKRLIQEKKRIQEIIQSINEKLKENQDSNNAAPPSQVKRYTEDQARARAI